MPESIKRSGSCVCGSVKFDVTLPSLDMHVCHCTICRKLAGGPAFAVNCEKDVALEGEENLTWYRSSKWAERAFCKICGTHLFFRLVDAEMPEWNMSASVLDKEDDFKITKHIYIDSKPPYYDLSDDAPRLTKEEFMAQLKEGM